MVVSGVALGYSLLSMIIFFGCVYLFWVWIYKNSSMRAYMLKERYCGLYELYKMNDQLEERGLSFKHLDKFELDIVGAKKTEIARIDEQYKKERKDIKKGK